jgi:hypothetical protein
MRSVEILRRTFFALSSCYLREAILALLATWVLGQGASGDCQAGATGGFNLSESSPSCKGRAIAGYDRSVEINCTVTGLSVAANVKVAILLPDFVSRSANLTIPNSDLMLLCAATKYLHCIQFAGVFCTDQSNVTLAALGSAALGPIECEPLGRIQKE